MTASLLPQLPLRGVRGGGTERCRDGEMKEGRGDERERSEFRDRLIYEFLFQNRAVFGDFTEMSGSGVHT